jgi:hypothetical protein
MRSEFPIRQITLPFLFLLDSFSVERKCPPIRDRGWVDTNPKSQLSPSVNLETGKSHSAENRTINYRRNIVSRAANQERLDKCGQGVVLSYNLVKYSTHAPIPRCVMVRGFAFKSGRFPVQNGLRFCGKN